MPTSSQTREIALIVAFGLLVRAAAIPFSQTMDPDATWRVWQAWQWLDHPVWITHGVWGPIHTYLNALALALGKDPVLAPVILHGLAAVALAVVVYRFTAEEFDPRGASAAALASLIAPLAFRNSLMALPEVWVGLFGMAALLAVGRLRRGRAGWPTALWGGVALTLAAGLRFECWLLIPLLGAMLWRRPAAMAIFCAGALAFPVAWLVSCHLSTGDPFWSIHYSSRFAMEVAGLDRRLTPGLLLIRLAFYPLTLALGLTPLLALACLAGMGRSLARRRPGRVWLIPLGVSLAALIGACLTGSITLKGRYLFFCAILCLPFLAECRALPAVEGWTARRRRWVTVLLLAGTVPLGYAGYALPGMWRNHYWKNIVPIPRVTAPTRALSSALNGAIRPGDGVAIDFIDWQTTEYLGLATRLPPERVLILKGAENSPVNLEEWAAFLERYPQGLLVLGRDSKFRSTVTLGANGELAASGESWRLAVDAVYQAERATLYRYRR